MEPYVSLKIENKVGIIEFFHPSHNALPSNLVEQLEAAFNQASANDEIRVIIFKSGGDRTFCAGANFNELLQISTEDEGTLFFSGFANVINAMRKCIKPIIGRIHGKARGVSTPTQTPGAAGRPLLPGGSAANRTIRILPAGEFRFRLSAR